MVHKLFLILYGMLLASACQREPEHKTWKEKKALIKKKKQEMEYNEARKKQAEEALMKEPGWQKPKPLREMAARAKEAGWQEPNGSGYAVHYWNSKDQPLLDSTGRRIATTYFDNGTWHWNWG